MPSVSSSESMPAPDRAPSSPPQPPPRPVAQLGDGAGGHVPRDDDPPGARGHGHRVEGRVIQVILFLVIVFGFRAIRVTVVEVIRVADAFITGVTGLTGVFEAAGLAVRDINLRVVTLV